MKFNYAGDKPGKPGSQEEVVSGLSVCENCRGKVVGSGITAQKRHQLGREIPGNLYSCDIKH